MNYYIALVNKYGEDWGLIESTDKNYLQNIMEHLALPPEYEKMELRETAEPIDTHLHYEVIAERNY